MAKNKVTRTQQPPMASARRRPRRARRGRSGQTIPTTFVPGPPVTRRYLTYESVLGLTEGAAGAGAFNSYRLNSIYDPDYTGTGTAALGYSTYAYLFGRYRVLGCRVILRFVDATAVPSGGQIVGVIFNANGTFTANPLNWPSQPYAHSKILQGTSGGANCVASFNLVPDLAKVAGVTKAQFKQDQDYSATFGSNPVTSLYAHVFLTGKLSSSAETARVEVRLIYDVEFSMPLATITV